MNSQEIFSIINSIYEQSSIIKVSELTQTELNAISKVFTSEPYASDPNFLQVKQFATVIYIYVNQFVNKIKLEGLPPQLTDISQMNQLDLSIYSILFNQDEIPPQMPTLLLMAVQLAFIIYIEAVQIIQSDINKSSPNDINNIKKLTITSLASLYKLFLKISSDTSGPLVEIKQLAYAIYNQITTIVQNPPIEIGQLAQIIQNQILETPALYKSLPYISEEINILLMYAIQTAYILYPEILNLVQNELDSESTTESTITKNNVLNYTPSINNTPSITNTPSISNNTDNKLTNIIKFTHPFMFVNAIIHSIIIFLEYDIKDESSKSLYLYFNIFILISGIISLYIWFNKPLNKY
jgi:hypothetical protein